MPLATQFGSLLHQGLSSSKKVMLLILDQGMRFLGLDSRVQPEFEAERTALRVNCGMTTALKPSHKTEKKKLPLQCEQPML